MNQRRFKILNSIWTFLGISILCIILLEMALGAAFFARSKIYPPVDPRSKAEGYQVDNWGLDYYDELRESYPTVWQPYIYWTRLGYDGNYINVDKQGLRKTVSPIGLDSAKNKTKIFVFGGSTVWGTSARDQYTIPSLLQESLRTAGFNVEVTNFGEGGYVSTQETILLIRELQKGNSPDIVVFYDGVNDIFSTFQNQIAGIPQNEQNRVREYNLLNNQIAKENANLIILGSMISKTNMYRLASSFVSRNEGVRENQSMNVEQLSEETISTYFANLRLIASLQEPYGFTAFMYWQPSIYNKLSLTEYESNQLNQSVEFQKLLESTNLNLEERSAEISELRFRNLSKVFSEISDPIFVDFVHINENGNGMIANEISEDIKGYLTNN